jgi:hypothetical protein
VSHPSLALTAARPTPGAWLVAAHGAAICAFAVAQPLYDVLRRNPEFFIAHRAGLGDLLVFTLLVSVALPLGLAGLWLLPTRWWTRARLPMAATLAGLLFAVLGSQLLAHRVPLPTPVHVLIALAAGAAGGWAYRARPAFRSFLTAATPAIVIFPTIFLLHPGMATFVRTETRDQQAAAQIGREAPPIVFLVFDQLPVSSLMDSRGGIDRERYPGFAALADTATWYRNATTVADFTGWALPPILTGLRPTPEKRPTSQSYPFNLFTWLGEAYQVESFEPITQLCPERLCDARDGTRLERVLGMLVDSSVVYLATALPEGPRQWLPPLTNDWRNFIDAQRWQRRWVTERNSDRRQAPQELIAGISRNDPAPTLYFAHTLLPHEPYIYLRSGQTFAPPGNMIGIRPRGLWSPDPWPSTLAYQRHLLQLEFVDNLVGRMLQKLRDEGLLERALIVVTSDHGVSFRPDRPFKGLRQDTLSDMMSVPLFVKAPGQRRGVVSDRNVQTVDVMPTLASILGVPLTWKADGLDAGSSVEPGSKKLMHHTGATKSMELDASWLAGERDKAVARKESLFGASGSWRAPAPGSRDLLGRLVADVEVADGDVMALVDSPQRFRAVALDGAELPVTISGRLRDGEGRPASGELAVAVGGRIVAMTRTFDSADAPRDSWRAFLDPAALRNGRNTVEVFVVSQTPGRALTRAFSTGQRPDTLNLASRGAADYFEVAQEGLLPREGSPIPFRWTTGDARLTVPLGDVPPKSLRVGLMATRAGGSEVSVSYNGCELFTGTVTAPWYRVFALAPCHGGGPADAASIVIRTPAWQDTERRRSIGVAVETINLFSHDWPPADEGPSENDGTLRLLDAAEPRVAGSMLKVELANLGGRTWLPAADAPSPERAVWLAIRWRASAGGRTAEQRVQLPRALYPTDRAVIEAPLVPPAEVPNGPWEVTIVLVDHKGTLVDEDMPVTFRVSPAPPAAP